LTLGEALVAGKGFRATGRKALSESARRPPDMKMIL